jgi:hypothetical protein
VAATRILRSRGIRDHRKSLWGTSMCSTGCPSRCFILGGHELGRLPCRFQSADSLWDTLEVKTVCTECRGLPRGRRTPATHSQTHVADDLRPLPNIHPEAGSAKTQRTPHGLSCRQHAGAASSTALVTALTVAPHYRSGKPLTRRLSCRVVSSGRRYTYICTAPATAQDARPAVPARPQAPVNQPACAEMPEYPAETYPLLSVHRRPHVGLMHDLRADCECKSGHADHPGSAHHGVYGCPR